MNLAATNATAGRETGRWIISAYLRAAAGARRDPSIFRFTTADYAPKDRLDAWREVYGNTLCKQDIEPTSRDRLDANVVFRRLAGLATMRGDLFQAQYRRKPSQVESDRLFLTIGLAGSFEVEQLGRSAHVRVGDGFVGTGPSRWSAGFQRAAVR